MDFREFCSLLGLRRVAVIGFSAGTPFAAALACVHPPLPPQPPPQPPSQPASQPGPPRIAPQKEGIPAAAAVQAPATAACVPHRAEAADARKEALRAEEASDAAAAQPDAAPGKSGMAALAAAPGAGLPGGEDKGLSERGASETGGGGVVVEGVALVSAIGPPDTPNKHRGMALLFRFGYWAASHAPWLVRFLVRSEAAAFRRRPLRALRRPEVEEIFLESALELYSRGQEEAVYVENMMFAGRAGWGLELGACRCPVAIWQGGQDRGCTPAMAEYLAARMGSRTGSGKDLVQVRVVPELGHMLYFDVWGEVVAWVNQLGTGSTAPAQ